MSRRFFLIVLSIAMIATGALAPEPVAATTAPCTLETFAALNLPETTIMLVESLPAGPNPSPVGNIALPICRVRGVITPGDPLRSLDTDGRLEREIPGSRQRRPGRIDQLLGHANRAQSQLCHSIYGHWAQLQRPWRSLVDQRAADQRLRLSIDSLSSR